jgi:hypothetical protein
MNGTKPRDFITSYASSINKLVVGVFEATITPKTKIYLTFASILAPSYIFMCVYFHLHSYCSGG